jgi:hypothetical protein
VSEKTNFLLGFGERLVEELAAPPMKPGKKHPYTVKEAKARLVPKVESVAADLAALPEIACPSDETVALVTLHPAYLAKTYFPAEFLRAAGIEAVGSRAREITPEKTARAKATSAPSVTAELYVAGPRKRFASLARHIRTVAELSTEANDLIKFEDFRTQPPTERLKSIRSKEDEVLLEVVLHAKPTRASNFIIEGFEAFLAALSIRADLDRRIYAEGLCFLPVKAPRSKVSAIAEFSFLRVAREMPRLRQFRPLTRNVPGFAPFACQVPGVDCLDSGIQVAVFDGGVPATADLGRWVKRKKGPGVSSSVDEYQQHGTAVTSALLFGPLEDGEPAPQPYAQVDHFRVLDDQTALDDQQELYPVLLRIRDVLQSRPYEFVSLSIGPDVPIEDNEVHAWTSVLDQILSSGRTLAAIAVGNTGERDWASGNARIQTPADCVNALAIGACDRTGSKWKRAPYSSIGPGRSPGVIKPDALSFGGSSKEPYWVLDTTRPRTALPVSGTSFAAPTALRTAIGIRAHFGPVLSPLALKALLLHACEDGPHDRTETGWGRIPSELAEIVLSDAHTAHIVYQGELLPAQWLRVPIPIPSDELKGMVEICATFCFASPTDPQDPINYTRSGLEVRFRPHDGKRKDKAQLHPDTRSFFQASEFYLNETELRADAHKWETTLHHSERMRGKNLRNPVFDVHYSARAGGRSATGTAAPISYALVVTVRSPRTPNLYDRVAQRYRTVLEPLQSVVKIPVKV